MILLPQKTRIRKDIADVNARDVVVSDKGSYVRKDNNSEPGQYISKNDRVISERFLGLTAGMDKIIQLGETLPLLFVLIRKCGGGNSCVENYGALAKECHIAVSTIKNWGNKLEQLGFIHKESIGPNGMKFTLNDEIIGRSDLFKQMDQRLSQSAEQIQATMVVAQNAFQQALISLKTGEN